MALCEQRLGKIVGPARFRALDLNEGGAKKVVIGLGLSALDDVAEFAESAIDFFFVAGIAAQQEIVEVEPVGMIW